MTDSLQIIPNKEISRGKKIGEGGFGEVYKGTWNNYEVAIKVLVLRDKMEEKDLVKDFVVEASAMAKLNNPAVIRLFGICTDPGKYAMVMELMPRGGLDGLLSDRQQVLPWNPLRWQLAIDVGSGLSFLHKNGIIHRDLKSMNIVLDHQLRAKITDFGLAKIKIATKSTSTYSGGGTVAWMAPEMFSRSIKKTKAVDIFSYGVLLWEIAAREIPFKDSTEGQIIGFAVLGEREDIPKDCPKNYANVIERCWQQKPEARPTANTALGMLVRAGGLLKRRVEKVRAPFPLKMRTVVVAGETDYRKGYALYLTCQYRDALPLLKRAAEAGYAPAYLRLHWLYDMGKAGPKDLLSAEEWKKKAAGAVGWFQKKAVEGTAEAQLDLGVCYEYGMGVVKNETMAAKFYKLAAGQRHVIAQCWLGWCYSQGIGVVKNNTMAVKFLKLAANQRYAEAQYSLGRCYEYGEGVNKSETMAVKFYKLAANQGHAGAQYCLGLCYSQGIGVVKNETVGVQFYRLAAGQGYVFAQTALGRCYFHGKGVVKNETMAVKFYRLAAGQGQVGAQNDLGYCYEHGTGVVKNETMAVKFYRLAADQGHSIAQFNLGRCYEAGRGVHMSETMAVKVYRLAAKQGHGSAKAALKCLGYG